MKTLFCLQLYKLGTIRLPCCDLDYCLPSLCTECFWLKSVHVTPCSVEVFGYSTCLKNGCFVNTDAVMWLTFYD